MSALKMGLETETETVFHTECWKIMCQRQYQVDQARLEQRAFGENQTLQTLQWASECLSF